jgi:DNA (cytosine-5)-methyltransferase 1
MSGLVLGGFGGPGGWAEALRMLGLAEVGIELDPAACLTRRAAGHRTIRADMAAFDVSRLAGKTWGQCHSAPCTTFSAAGDGAGNVVTDILAAGIRDLFAGRDTRTQRRREIGRALLAAGWIPALPVKAGRAAKIATAARTSVLVLEPARFIAAGMPEWVALEQVPSVLPLWKVYAEELRKLGYSVWCGTLNSADYGVPQTRIRAILIASRARTVGRPGPTHYDPRKGMQLWGTPWVSMADALGFGATERPGPAVTAGGTATGGAEPFPTRARNLLEAERDAGRWALRRSRGEGMLDREGRGGRRDHPVDEPAPTITSAGAKVGANLTWVLQRQVGKSLASSRRDHELDRPAPTITGGGSAAGSGNGAGLAWKFRNNNNNNACERSLDEPAGTLFFSQRSNWAAWTAGQDSVRISVQEAAVLQSFRPDYPWQGTKTAQFRQVGDAVPPRLAMAVCGEATGIAWQELAARFYGESEAAA